MTRENCPSRQNPVTRGWTASGRSISTLTESVTTARSTNSNSGRSGSRWNSPRLTVISPGPWSPVPCPRPHQGRHGVRRDPFPPSDRSHSFSRRSFDIDGGEVNAECGGEPFLHLRDVRCQTRSFGEYGGVHVHHAPAGVCRQRGRPAQQLDAIGIL